MPRARGKAANPPSSGAPDASDAPRAAAVPADLPFEQAIERLEGVVDALDDGELDLEAALAAFEEGVALSKHCAAQLDRAERRIELLVEEGGELLAKPFAAFAAEGDGDADDAADDTDGAF